MSCKCVEQDLVQRAVEAEHKRLREEQRIKRALDDKFPTADNVPDEVMCITCRYLLGRNEKIQ